MEGKYFDKARKMKNEELLFVLSDCEEAIRLAKKDGRESKYTAEAFAVAYEIEYRKITGKM